MSRTQYGLPGVYNASPITLPDGKGGALAVDSSGRLLVSPVSGGSNVNIADIAGTTTSVGNGTTDAGTLRVTISSDSTGQVIAQGNVASGSADSGNPVKIGGVQRTSPPTLTDGQRGDWQLDTRANGKISLYLPNNSVSNTTGADNVDGQAVSATVNKYQFINRNTLFNGTTWDRQYSGGVTGMAGVSLQASPSGGWAFSNISTSTTTTVKSGAGTFHLASVNTLGTVASTCTFYDNTAGSGTIIAIINSLTLSGSFTYDIAFSTGLTVVTTGTAAPNLTVAYK